MNQVRVSLPLYGLLLLLALKACLQLPAEKVPEAVLVSPRLGTFIRQVEMVGEVEARKQVFLAPNFSAKLQKLAEDGSSVKAREQVALLDVKDEEEELEDQQMELDAARSALQEHDRSTASEKVRLAAEIQRAEAELQQKQLALRELEAGTRPEELQKKQLQQTLAFKAHELAQANLALKEKLALRGMSTRLEILQARLELSLRARDLRVAEAETRLARAGASRLQRQAARLELEIARLAVNWARRNQSLILRRLALERQKKQARLESSQLKVKRLQRRIQQVRILAPLSGTVVINRSWTPQGLKRVEVGDEVFEGNPFMSIANLTDVRIRSELDETLIRHVQPGMPCTLSLPSLKGRSFSARVQRVGVFAHLPAQRQNTQGLNKVFDLEILPVTQEDLLKPGTSVDIRLPLQIHEQVLLLPRAAIYRDSQGHYVRLASGTLRRVQLGAVNSREVIIRQGLSEQDQVQLPGPAETQASPRPAEGAP